MNVISTGLERLIGSGEGFTGSYARV